MKKIVRILLASLVLVAFSIMLPGCEQESHIYDGPPVVEFSNFSWGIDLPTTARPHYAWNATGAFWSTTITGVRADTSLQVQLVGPHQNQDITLSYRIEDTVYFHLARNTIFLERPVTNADGTPAVAGTHFQIWTTTALPAMYTIRNNGEVRIPANSSFGRLRIGLDPSTIPLPLTLTRDIWIVLEEGMVKPSENYKFFRLRIQRIT